LNQVACFLVSRDNGAQFNADDDVQQPLLDTPPEPLVVIMEQTSRKNHHIDADPCSMERIANTEEIRSRLAELDPPAALQIATVAHDRFDSSVAALVGRAAVLITMVHPEPHCNAGLAYSVLLPPGASVWLVASAHFGTAWPLGPGAFKHGLLADLTAGGGIRYVVKCDVPCTVQCLK
jgi:hypothetical protein